MCQFSVGIWFRFSSWAHVRKSPAQFKHHSLTPALRARRGDVKRAFTPAFAALALRSASQESEQRDPRRPRSARASSQASFIPFVSTLLVGK
jgi:hypothetical protein